MIFKDQYDSSFWNKSVFSGCILLTIFAALWLMFIDCATSNTWLRPYQLSGDLVRRILIAFCLIIYFMRLQVTVWVFQKRKWTWLETITITVLMSFVGYTIDNGGEFRLSIDILRRSIRMKLGITPKKQKSLFR